MQLRPDVSGLVKRTASLQSQPELSEVLKWLAVELSSGKRTFNSRRMETAIAKSTAVICYRRLRRRPFVTRRLSCCIYCTLVCTRIGFC